MAFSTELINFANGNTDLFVAFQDYFNHKNEMGTYRKDVELETKAKKVHDAFFAEVENRANVAMAGLQREVWAANPQVQWAAMTIVDAMISQVLPQMMWPQLNMFCDIRPVGNGDLAKFTIPPRTRYTVSRGSHGERTTLRTKSYKTEETLVPVQHMITVYSDMWSVLCGKEDIAEFVKIAVMSMEAEIVKDAYATLSAAVDASPDKSVVKVKGAMDKTTLLQLCQSIQAYNNNAKPIIAGSAAAIASLPTVGTEYHKVGEDIGFISNFFGYQAIVMDNFASSDKNPGAGTETAQNGYANVAGLMLDDKKLFVISGGTDKILKGVINEAFSNTNAHLDNADLTQNYTLRKDWNFMALSGAYIGCYEMT